MIIIFDLDYTLFDTARFKRDGLALFFNMNEAEFRNYYKKNFKDQGINYSPKKHLQILGWKYKEVMAKLNELDDWLEKEISRYLFPAAEEILNKFKQAGHKIILASFGDQEFQEQKISALKINGISAKEFFDEVIISDKVKAELKELKRFQGENVLLVDDNLREAVDLKEILGNKCEIFLIDGPYARYGKDDVVPRSLKELAEKFFPEENETDDKLKIK